MTKRRLAILGSTGSIGKSALSVVDAHPDRVEVVALAAGTNVSVFAEQVARYRPAAVAMASGQPLTISSVSSAAPFLPRTALAAKG